MRSTEPSRSWPSLIPHAAQGITDSLALLASLRPRPSGGDPDKAPLIPPASVLHKLHRTLPLEATEGWYGTLPEGRTTAFRDDTTVYVRAGSAATKPAAAPATPAPKATTPAPPYTPYPYSGGYQPSPYRAGYGGTYTASQTTGYYANAGYTPTTPQTQTAGAQYGGQQYYPWYTASVRSTPQPAAAGAGGQTSTYNGYYGAQQPQPTPQRAVANTVLSSAKQAMYPSTTWNGTAAAGGYVAPTLPPHMRSAVGAAATPGTPPPASPAVAGAYGGYYAGYPTPR